MNAIMEQVRQILKGRNAAAEKRADYPTREMLDYDVTDEACEQMRRRVEPSLVGKKFEAVNSGVRRARR